MNIFKNLKTPLLVVGIGNPMKGDDGAGPMLADRLTIEKKKTPALNCLEVPENYIGKITRSGAATILLADAVEMGAPAGTVKLLGTDAIRETGVSTHGISLSFIADTIRDESGAEVYLLGIQPKSVKLGEGLSAEVIKSIENILTQLD